MLTQPDQKTAKIIRECAARGLKYLCYTWIEANLETDSRAIARSYYEHQAVILQRPRGYLLSSHYGHVIVWGATLHDCADSAREFLHDNTLTLSDEYTHDGEPVGRGIEVSRDGTDYTIDAKGRRYAIR